MIDYYIYKRNEYEFISLGKMKHPESGKWIECVIYKDANNEYYSRELNDFNNKFLNISSDIRR